MQFFDGPILAIETSCDETSASVVLNRKVLSNVVSSQAKLHIKWGGVVPEMAARAHVEAILPVIEESLTAAKINLDDIKAIAVTTQPGLVGSLSVGLTAAKALSWQREIPLIGVHHIEGHMLSILADVGQDELFPEDAFPHLCLVVSGGHTELVEVLEPLQYRLLGATLDDAAGEAFDKTARLLGFGLPGGKAIEESAAGHNAKRYSLPRAVMDDPYNFSFSGLKTAMLRLIGKQGPNLDIGDASASLQEAVVDVLVNKAVGAAESLGYETLTVVGGVSANKHLRERLNEKCKKLGIYYYSPPIEISTDNAAMIGLVGSLRLARGQRDGIDLDVSSNAELPGLLGIDVL